MKFIPGGRINSLQPLDRAVFGTLKGAARRMFRMEAMDYVGAGWQRNWQRSS
jgi:hypothetical protein